MKRCILVCALCVCALVACNAKDAPHEHRPDGADCQHVQYCADCGEQLADRGAHVYADQPDREYDGYAFYACRICEEIKIVNEHGAPVVPVE